MSSLREFKNMDCMEEMAEFPTNYFDVAIVDPPILFRSGKKKILWKKSQSDRSSKDI